MSFSRTPRGDDVVMATFPLAATSIPEHLRYTPPPVPQLWTNVSSRYMEEKPKSPRAPPSKDLFKPQVFPTVKSFSNVQSRLLEPRHKPNAGEGGGTPGKDRAKTPIPVFASKDIVDHKAWIARTGLDRVASRHLAVHANAEGKESTSPRERVRAEREGKKRLLSWRDVTTNALPATFDELRARNVGLLAKSGMVDHYTAKPDNKSVVSVVGEFLRLGTPIKHNGVAISPLRRAASASRGGRGGRDSETGSTGSAPTNRARWVPGGGGGGGSWERRAKSPVRPATERVERALEASRAEAAAATKSPLRSSSPAVPRVASLAPAAMLHTLLVRANSAASANGAGPEPFGKLGFSSSGSSVYLRQPSGAAVAPGSSPQSLAGSIRRVLSLAEVTPAAAAAQQQQQSPAAATTASASAGQQDLGVARRQTPPRVQSATRLTASPAPVSEQVMVGPVRLAIPAGAVVRMHMLNNGAAQPAASAPRN